MAGLIAKLTRKDTLRGNRASFINVRNVIINAQARYREQTIQNVATTGYTTPKDGTLAPHLRSGRKRGRETTPTAIVVWGCRVARSHVSVLS
jgi:hypothetical protein